MSSVPWYLYKNDIHIYVRTRSAPLSIQAFIKFKIDELCACTKTSLWKQLFALVLLVILGISPHWSLLIKVGS